jgi:hypothetical protein
VGRALTARSQLKLGATKMNRRKAKDVQLSYILREGFPWTGTCVPGITTLGINPHSEPTEIKIMIAWSCKLRKNKG